VVEVSRIVLNLVSLAINIGLVYFGIKLLLIFKGGRIEKPWLYITVGALILVAGSFLFSMYYILSLPRFVHHIGGVVSMVGGAFLLAGLRREYRNWSGNKVS
jgi:hypothetical protein